MCARIFEIGSQQSSGAKTLVKANSECMLDKSFQFFSVKV